MIDRGSETEADRALREWYAEQQGKNFDRLEEACQDAGATGRRAV